MGLNRRIVTAYYFMVVLLLNTTQSDYKIQITTFKSFLTFLTVGFTQDICLCV